MSTLYYICSIIGIFVIIRWYIKNDGRSHTTGLLALKDPDQREPDAQDKIRQTTRNKR
jgi:hypothetical protein